MPKHKRVHVSRLVKGGGNTGNRFFAFGGTYSVDISTNFLEHPLFSNQVKLLGSLLYGLLLYSIACSMQLPVLYTLQQRHVHRNAIDGPKATVVAVPLRRRARGDL